jgi:hypothetical protein
MVSPDTKRNAAFLEISKRLTVFSTSLFFERKIRMSLSVPYPLVESERLSVYKNVTSACRKAGNWHTGLDGTLI